MYLFGRVAIEVKDDLYNISGDNVGYIKKLTDDEYIKVEYIGGNWIAKYYKGTNIFNIYGKFDSKTSAIESAIKQIG